MIPESFHFLRPAWLAALLPLALVVWAAARSGEQGSAWRRLVDQHLLRHLIVKGDGRAQRWPLAVGALAGVATCLALAGPTWQQIPQPTFSNVEPTVVLLDMSPAMNVDDLAPSRLTRARHKLQDILERTRGGQIGLVLYTDEPFVAAPLTDDGRVIAEMVPTLASGLMPLRAARPDRAIAQAQALLDQAGVPAGRVVLITDGVGAYDAEATAAAQALAASGRTLSVLGAGTDAGAPLRDARGRIVDGNDGKPLLSRLDRPALAALASAGGGRFSELSADDGDLASLVPARPAGVKQATQSGSSAQSDVWRDTGIWLVLIPLFLAPLAFRRGLLAALALTLLAATSAHAETSAWSDLWSRRDQQAQAALAAGNAAEAATLFEHPEWKAAANYQSGNYADSAASYAKLDGDENHYNLGNALARSGKLQEAVAAYDQVLAKEPGHADAKFNRDLVQHLLDEQRKQQEQQKKDQQQQQQSGGQGEQQQKDAQNQQGGGKGDGQTSQQDSQQDGSRQQDKGSGADQQQNAAPGGDDSQQENQQANEQPSPQNAGDGQDAAHQASASKQQNAGDEHEQDGAQQQAAAPPPSSQDAGAQQDQRAASAQGEPASEQPEQQAARAGGTAQQPADDSSRDETARANQQDNEAAQQDKSLAQGLDQALRDGAEPQDPQQASADHDDAKPNADAHAAKRPLTEREQAREQALRNIPDDPGGLLRAKIRRQYAEQRYSQQEVTPSW